MIRCSLFVGMGALVLTSGCAGFRPDKAIRVASGFTSHSVCAGAFIAGLPPDAVYADRVAALPQMGTVTWGLEVRVDPERQAVETKFLGGFESRAQFRPGLGCLVRYPGDATLTPVSLSEGDARPVTSPAITAQEDLRAGPAALQAALIEGFREEPGAPARRTKAIVVQRDGQILAEHYAPGYGPETPLPGYSMTKSVLNALTGILVRQGRLSPDQPAPIDAWADPSDPHHPITVDHLLRQASGLDLPADNSGFDRATQISLLAWDKAAVAALAPLSTAPGTRWAYSDPNSILLARALANVIGNGPAGFLRFAHGELFDPLGMKHVTLDFDGAGTPMGAASMLASARDWARFGQFFLDQGRVGALTLLPETWVAYSTRPTLETGYGAGFWTNRHELGGLWGMPNAPAGSYFARGFQGQFIVIIPSERLVITRLAAANGPGDDIGGMNQLVGAIRQAIADSLP